MGPVIGNLATQYRLLFKKTVATDNVIFRFHYRLTVTFLLACTALVSSRQFFSEPMTCIAHKIIASVATSYCYVASTYTVGRHHDQAYHSVWSRETSFPHPGVGPRTPHDEQTYHSYYQWVPLVLTLQSLSFYISHFIWKCTGSKRLSYMISRVNSLPLTSEEDVIINGMNIDCRETKDGKVDFFKKHFLSSVKHKTNCRWAIPLVFCELLNLANVALHMYILDWFLDGKYLTLGYHWLNNGGDFLKFLFPKMTKCTFNSYGSSGNIQNFDALCIIPLNLYNEVIYTAIWFWFVVLFALTFVCLAWRIASMLFLRKSTRFNCFLLELVSPGPLFSEMENIEVIGKKLSSCDWLYLYYICKGLDGGMFRMCLAEIVNQLSEPRLPENADRSQK